MVKPAKNKETILIFEAILSVNHSENQSNPSIGA
jgi:hypothetical protein